MVWFEAELTFSVISFSSVRNLVNEINYREKHYKISITLMAQDLQWPQTFHYYPRLSFIALVWASFLCVTLKLEIILLIWAASIRNSLEFS